jgi:hypothetical protein
VELNYPGKQYLRLKCVCARDKHNGQYFATSLTGKKGFITLNPDLSDWDHWPGGQWYLHLEILLPKGSQNLPQLTPLSRHI